MANKDKNHIVIGNCIVSNNMNNGIRIVSIKMMHKINPNFNVSTGNKHTVNHILSQLSDGLFTYTEFFNTYVIKNEQYIMEMKIYKHNVKFKYFFKYFF